MQIKSMTNYELVDTPRVSVNSDIRRRLRSLLAIALNQLRSSDYTRKPQHLADCLKSSQRWRLHCSDRNTTEKNAVTGTADYKRTDALTAL